ncbi:MAG TPA: hypothetical protein VHZ24_08850 [Pirellulales bacterium]|jgi:hypothetical protein|nr:hypothetical protein [Pirellulales bacterium]
MKRALMVLAFLSVATSVCLGQYYRGYHRRGYGGGGGGGTVFGSYASGMGNMIRSQGVYNQLTAQAMIDAEQAQSMALDNKLKATQTYFDMRKVNQEAAAAERSRTAELARGDRKYDAALAQHTSLTVSQLDPVTGHIKWPTGLMGDASANDRAELEKLFARRAQHQDGDVSPGRVHELTENLRTQMNADVKTLRPQEFTDATHFLRGLDSAAVDGNTSQG